MKFLKWIESIFRKDSQISSKRITGVLIVNWCLFISTYVIWGVMKGKAIPEIATVSTLITFAFGTGVALLTGGTVAEAFTKRDKKLEGK